MAVEEQSKINRVLKLSNETYDRLRQVVQYWLPGIGTFYFSIAAIWGLPYGEQVVASAAALALLLGVFLGISNRVYEADGSNFDGEFVVNVSDPMVDTIRLEVGNGNPLDLVNQDKVVLKVRQE